MRLLADKRIVNWGIKKLIVICGLVAGLLAVNLTRAQSAEIQLATIEDQIKVSVPFQVQISINSAVATLGTDLKLSYDSDKLKLLEVIPSEIYPNFSNLENAVETKGQVYLSAVAEITKGVVPNGNLAILKFLPKDSGETAISVVYDPSDTTATAVIPFEENKANLLTQPPEPLLIEIKAASWRQRLWFFLKEFWVAASFLKPFGNTL